MKGTPTMGKRSTGKLHIACRRCGNISFHMKKGVCASCGYGKSARLRQYSTVKKVRNN